MPKPRENVTVLLRAVIAGDRDAGNRLFSVLYRELHSLAHAAMREEHPGHILQTTALVHEAYIRLVQDKDERWENRTHFFSTSARAMRRILVEEARNRKAAKRGHGLNPVSLDELRDQARDAASAEDPFEELEALDKALDNLEAHAGHKRKCTVVKLHPFLWA